MKRKRDAATAAGASLAPKKNAPANKGKGKALSKLKVFNCTWLTIGCDAAIISLLVALMLWGAGL